MTMLNPYIRIMQAAKNGTGVTMSAAEVRYMAQDAAITEVAIRTQDGEKVDGGGYLVTKEGFVDKQW